MVAIKFAVLEPGRIFNLTSPRWTPEISRLWSGKRDWHDPHYEPLRDLIEETYIDAFNRLSGHYEYLLESVANEGFRNPIIVSAGGLQRRKMQEIPPLMRKDDLIVCEYIGGTRLWAAENLGLPVPCIVNDYANILQEAEILHTASDILEKFADIPGEIRYIDEGVYINELPYVHLPIVERYNVKKQCEIRQVVLTEVKERVIEWMRAYDK